MSTIVVTDLAEVAGDIPHILGWMSSPEEIADEYARQSRLFHSTGMAHFCDDEGYSFFYMTQAAVDRLNER